MSTRNINLSRRLSHAKSTKSESFENIDIDAITNNPLQPRLHINNEDLNDLAKSIKKHGLIQPIFVIKKDDKFILQAGQRRWLAYKLLGLKTIKAIVVHEESDVSRDEAAKSLFEIAIVENTQRENLDTLELAISLQNVLDKKLYKNREELSRAVGKSASYVGKVLKVLTLDKKIIEDLKLNKSTNDVESLYEIQKIKERKEQVSVYFDFIKKKIDRKGLRELNRSKKDANDPKTTYKFTGRAKKVKLEYDVSKLTDEEIENIKKELRDVLKKFFS